MTAQLSLYGTTLAERFERFDSENPHVYKALLDLAREWKRRMSDQRVGIGALFEVARWRIMLATNDPTFKLNNSYRAFYARKLMLHNPDLSGMFQLRFSEADAWAQAKAAS